MNSKIPDSRKNRNRKNRKRTGSHTPWKRIASLSMAVLLVMTLVLSSRLSGVLAEEDVFTSAPAETSPAEETTAMSETDPADQDGLVPFDPSTDTTGTQPPEQENQEENDPATPESPAEEEPAEDGEGDAADVEEISIEDGSSQNEVSQNNLEEAGLIADEEDITDGAAQNVENPEISQLIDADVALLKWKAVRGESISVTVAETTYTVSDENSYQAAYGALYVAMCQAATEVDTITTQTITADAIWMISGNAAMTGTVNITESGRLVILGEGTIQRQGLSENSDSSISLKGKLCLQGTVTFDGGGDSYSKRFLKAAAGSGTVPEIYITDDFKIQNIVLENEAGAGIHASGAGVYMSGGTIGSSSITFVWDDGTETSYGNATETYLGSRENNNAYPYLKSIKVNNGCMVKVTKEQGINGAGIYAFDSVFYMSDGSIVGNTLLGMHSGDAKKISCQGAGSYFNKCNINITGGKISGNQSNTTSEAKDNYDQYSGAIQLDNGSVCVLSNVEISYNYAQRWVGAIDIRSNNKVIMNPGTVIKYNCAGSNSGAIAVDGTSAVMDMNGGQIIHNYSGGLGGGVRCLGTLTMNAGEISYNYSVSNAAGLSVQTDKDREGKAILNGGSIHHNNSAMNGGGMGIVTEVTNGTSGLTLQGTAVYSNKAQENGGGFFIDAKRGTVNVELNKGDMYENQAKNGGGVYINQTNECTATLSMTSDEMIVKKNIASENGGGIYLNHNTEAGNTGSIAAVIQSGHIRQNTALNGAGAYLQGGNLEINGGYVTNNTATVNGGGACLSGGNLTINGGDISDNNAVNGAGAYVSDGKIRMFGGMIRGNQASGDGGGMYVSSENQAADVVIRSGTLSNNKAGTSETDEASGNGGAIAVVSKDGKALADIVVIGLCETHTGLDFATRKFTSFSYKDEKDDNKDHTHESCPVFNSNHAAGNGGGVYMGSENAVLDIYCLQESGNISDTDSAGNSAMTSGGTVNIGDQRANDEGADPQQAKGNVYIQSSMLVAGGTVNIYGNMENPYFADNILVKMQQGAGTFQDHRKSLSNKVKEYKIHYFENFQGSGTYTAKQYEESKDISAEGALFVHEGYTIKEWNTQNDGNGTAYLIGASIGSEDNHAAWGEDTDAPLILYAIWEKNTYTVQFSSNAPQGTAVTGTMADQKFTYGEKQSLSENTFKITGKRFNGWNTKPDGTGTSFVADYSESKMTRENNGTVSLYAQWVTCTHNAGDHQGNLTYTKVENQSKPTITEACDCGGHTVTVALSGTDVYYDQKQHPAAVNVTGGTLLVPQPAVQYQYSQNDTGNFEPMPADTPVPVNVGYYKASITIESQTIAVIYQIKSPSAGSSIEAKVTGGQVFAEFQGQNQVAISGDDAFTVQYTVLNLKTDTYTDAPVLTFSQTLPAGTAIIMQTYDSKGNGKYWKNTSPSGTEISLDTFTEMGGTAAFDYASMSSAENQTYRFTIDFSKVDAKARLTGKLDSTLKYTYGNTDLQGTAGITLNTPEAFGMSSQKDSGTIKVTAPSAAADSRWSGRTLVMILAPDADTKLPGDALLTMTVGGASQTFRPDTEGNFILPLNWSADQDVSLSVSSGSAAAKGKNYSFKAKLYTGSKDSQKLIPAGDYDTEVSLAQVELKIPEDSSPSLKITGTTRLVTKGTDKELKLTVAYKKTDGCTITAKIEKKVSNNYEGTFLQESTVKNGENSFSLGGITDPGSYRLVITVTGSGRQPLTVPYYFIVQ